METFKENTSYNEMEKISKKMGILGKKKERWGLTKEEERESLELMLEYLKNYYQLIDEVFLNYVEPFLYNEKIIDIKSDLKGRFDWDGQLYFNEANIENFVNKIDDKEYFLEMLDDMIYEEIKMYRNDIIKTDLIEVEELFSDLTSVKDNCVEIYIRTRYSILKALMEDDIDEAIKEICRRS